MSENQTIQNMLTRRSMRQFSDRMVPREIINQIIEAGLYAASGKNQQKTKIIAVTDKSMRDKLSRTNCQIGGWQNDFDPFYGAPVVLIVIADKSWPTYIYDGSLVIGNLMLAAHALGVDSCWIHRAKEEFEMPEYQQWLHNLGIEGQWEGIGHCILGYSPTKTTNILPRIEGRVLWCE